MGRIRIESKAESVLSVFRIFVPAIRSKTEVRASVVGKDAWNRRGLLSKRRLLDVAEVVSLLRASKFYGQATKGARWMPWQKQAMKDVASCDKLRGAAHRR